VTRRGEAIHEHLDVLTRRGALACKLRHGLRSVAMDALQHASAAGGEIVLAMNLRDSLLQVFRESRDFSEQEIQFVFNSVS
jgi:hypothetical protein